MVEPISRELGWDKAAIGGAYSSTVLIAGLLGAFVGRAVDRFGARVLMSAGSLVMGAALIVLGDVRTLWEFYLVWGLGIGLGTALLYYPVSFTVVANWFESRRMNAFSALTFMGAFSSPVFYPLNGALVGTLGWRGAVAVLGGIQLAVTFPLHAFVLRRRPEDVRLPPDGLALREALRTRTFWLITLAFSLSFFASTTVLVEHIAYLISRGYAPTLVASIVGLIGVSYLPGRLAVAIGSRRLGLRTLIAIAFALEALGIAWLNSAFDLVVVIAYVVAFGAAYGALAPLRGAIVAEAFGRRAYGAIITAQGIPIAVLGALGPFVGGRLIDRIGYPACFEICIATLAIAIVAIALSR